jgi:CheY-like chemotaxis protein
MKVLQGKRIFIVEDDALNRLVFRLALTKAGATVEFDGGGINTLPLLQFKMPADLILLDLMLPLGQSGYDLFQDIRTLPPYARTPIVAVSATDPTTGAAQARALGFHGFIAKPVDIDLLPRDLAHILQGNTVWPEGTVPLRLDSAFALETGPLNRIHLETGTLGQHPARR